MTRAELLAAVAAATAAPTTRPSIASKPPVSAIVTLQRDANALLAPFTVAIAIENATKTNMVLEFPTADLFRIDVLRDDNPIWSSLAGHKPIPVNRMITVPPGVTKLASMTIDGTTDDKRSYAPGKYVIRVAMLGNTFGAVVDKDLEIAPPTPIDDVLRGRPGNVYTISGEQIFVNNYPNLRDSTGIVRISRSLGLRPVGIFVVRGFLDATGDDRIFDIGRFAQTFEGSATPAP